jgi:Flp pilus assembly protein TadD
MLALLLALVATPVVAVPPNPNTSRPPNDPMARLLVEVQRLVAAGDFAGALPRVSKITADDPEFADAWAVQGFVLRQLGERDKAYSAYRTALTLDPVNRPAASYLGELFLQWRDLDGARAQAARLAELCPYGCPERERLDAAIAAYK